MRKPFPFLSLACCTALSAVTAFADPFLDRITITNAYIMPNTAGTLDMASGSATCPDETILITGGAAIRSDNNGIPGYVALVASSPSGNGWSGIAREMTDYTASTMSNNLVVTAVCGITHQSASPHIQMVTTNVSINRAPAYPDVGSATAACPGGTTLIGGGAEVLGANGLVPLQVALMTSRASGNAWYGLAREMQDYPTSQATLSVRALCADAGSGLSAVEFPSAVGPLADDPSYPDVGSAVASCPAGKSRLGGGAQILSSNGGIPPSVALMTTEPNGTGAWYAVAREMTNIVRAPLTVNVTSFASCATLSGVSGLQVVTRTASLPNTAGILDHAAGAVQCPAGKSLIGGGARIVSSNGGIPPAVALVSDIPFGNGWKALMKETTDSDRSLTVNLTVSAVCAILPP